MTRCPDIEALSAFLDGEAGRQADEIRRHLESCAACRALAAEMVQTDALLKAEARQETAPATLTAWIERRSAYERARPRTGFPVSRRTALIGGGAAVAAGLSVMVLRGGWSADPFAPTLFRDFATSMAADRALDFQSADLARVAQWLEARLPFLPPRLPGLEPVALRGGRLCWLFDRRVAAVHFEHQGRETCLYMAQATGLTLTRRQPLPGADGADVAPALLNGDGAAGAFWRDPSLAYAIISAAPLDAIGDLARTVLRTL